MIIYYDALLIDDESLLGVRHSKRYERLRNLIVIRPGHAELIDRQTIDIGSPHAASDLRKAFAKAIIAREEGLVLKPDDPFLDPDSPASHRGSPIKFKKEYIGSFGDVGDFAVVGARYDPGRAKGYRIPGLKWTHFYLGCVGSKSELYTAGATPEFTIVAVVGLNETMLRAVVQAQPPAVPARDNRAFKLAIPQGLTQGRPPTVIFPRPLVFDVRCFSFDKEGNVGFLTPRFPVVSKVHFGRDYRDAITFPELRELAERATKERGWEERDSQEMLGWVAALEGADPGGRPVDCLSQETVSSGLTPIELSEDVPEEASVVSSASSGGSSPESSRSRVTLTPPTSLPEQPSSDAEDGDRAGSACSKKRRSVGDCRQRACGDSPFKRRDSGFGDCVSPRRSGRGPLAGVGAPEGAAAGGASGALHPGMGLEGASSQPLPVSSPPPTTTAIARAQSPESTSTTPDPPNILPPSEPATSQCPLKGPDCPFYNRPFLLPSSLASRPDVRKALLQHGIASYITDHAAWRPKDVRRPDTWKVCLVDVDDGEGTRGFLEGVEGRPLKRAVGREYIEVYDWRVLSGVGNLERGEGEAGGRDPFKRWFVGLV